MLLETEDDSVRLTATDLEVGARVSIPARVMGKGAITVGARKLTEIVKELPAAAVAMKVGENAGGESSVRRRHLQARGHAARRFSARGAGLADRRG